MKIFNKKIITIFCIFFFSSFKNVSANKLDPNWILVCPSFYQILAPIDIKYFNESRKALKSYFELGAVQSNRTPSLFMKEIGESMGHKNIYTVDQFIGIMTLKLRGELKIMKNREKAERIMTMCPLFWPN